MPQSHIIMRWDAIMHRGWRQRSAVSVSTFSERRSTLWIRAVFSTLASSDCDGSGRRLVTDERDQTHLAQDGVAKIPIAVRRVGSPAGRLQEESSALIR